jgi:hypothetical protein
MMATVLVAGSQVTTGWKWLAVLIALAAIGGFLIVVGISVTKPPWEWIQDPNGTSSTSKFQWLLFLVAVLFAYVALWIVRAKQGNYSAVPDVPDNILIVLGFSTATMATSKGIKVASVNATKRAAEAEALAAGSAPTVARAAGVAAATALAPPAGVGGIFVDDEGFPDLSKIQLVAFTLVTLGIFIATVIHQIASNPPVTSLPDIDGTLMVLMGISSGGYLAKKTVADLAPRP